MNNKQKQQIADQLLSYCEQQGSQNKAVNTMKKVSSATVSHMLKGSKQLSEGIEPEAWSLITDEMWRNVASQIKYSDDEWIVVETRDFIKLRRILAYSKSKSKVSFITGATGSGKTEAIDSFVAENANVFRVKCNDFWNRKAFLSELLSAMGVNSNGYTVYELMNEIVRRLKKMKDPQIILDEGDKVNDQILYFFITLYNNLEDHCSIILIATEFLQKRIERGISLGKKGYPEIFSRGSNRFIELDGVCFSDVQKICTANGVTKASDIKDIYEDSDLDIRRIKTKIRAFKELVQSK